MSDDRTIRVRDILGRFVHMSESTPARLKTPTAEGPMVPIGSFAPGTTVEYHAASGWRAATVEGEPRVIEFKVLLQETPRESADSLGATLLERVRRLESFLSCDKVTP